MIKSFGYLVCGAVMIPSITLAGSTVYLYPEFRTNPAQFWLAFQRVYRVVKAGTNMALAYLTQPDQPMDDKHYYGALQLRQAFQQNKGLYIKFGQILGSLDIIIPEPYRATFEVMCTQNIETPFDDIERQIQLSTGKKIEELFQTFSKKPISSASIAQVHQAFLKDGREVAVKIQHPWLKEQIDGDVKLISLFTDVAEFIFKGFKYKWLAEELQVNLPKELDFHGEINNAKRIKEILKPFPDIYIPKVYEEYCNDRIIVMEFIHGTPLSDILREKEKHDFNYPKIAHTISTAFAHQIFKHGFVHSDPHKGNIMVRKLNGKQQVVLLDHGLYTTLTEKTRLSYSLLWQGILEMNLDYIKQATNDLGAAQNYKLFASMVTSKRFSDLMNTSMNMQDRLKRPKDQDEIAILIQKAAKKHKQITIILNQIDRKLLMLFKINDFLKNIEFRLGNPIDSCQITYKYVSMVNYEDKIKKQNIFRRMMYKFRLLLHKAKFEILSIVMSIIM
ncbi:unnamed protein product [Paramecium pentaurelia]|uniref:ABC1 atypical kinase-like domain-containing protein n=1 Tax=Paramecium pentaurelia TaxID=43138 RepID=A0A8S1URB5_9CILI|nr:unnamed protein product [Paramecium pentaurelia]